MTMTTEQDLLNLCHGVHQLLISKSIPVPTVAQACPPPPEDVLYPAIKNVEMVTTSESTSTSSKVPPPPPAARPSRCRRVTSCVARAVLGLLWNVVCIAFVLVMCVVLIIVWERNVTPAQNAALVGFFVKCVAVLIEGAVRTSVNLWSAGVTFVAAWKAAAM